MNDGFLGTAAPRYADLVLLLEIVMGVGLLIGAVLARLQRFRLHAWCQSVIVLLNLIVIVLVMIPSFRDHVIPKIPAKLGKAYYAVATAHAALGSVAEIGGLYILLSAGTKILPQKLRITEYKLWMRSVLALWWLVLLLGLATYTRWYVRICFGNDARPLARLKIRGAAAQGSGVPRRRLVATNLCPASPPAVSPTHPDSSSDCPEPLPVQFSFPWPRL